jgi:hypothetical protein
MTDYSQFTVPQLLNAYHRIDKELAPENYASLSTEFERRQNEIEFYLSGNNY